MHACLSITISLLLAADPGAPPGLPDPRGRGGDGPQRLPALRAHAAVCAGAPHPSLQLRAPRRAALTTCPSTFFTAILVAQMARARLSL